MVAADGCRTVVEKTPPRLPSARAILATFDVLKPYHAVDGIMLATRRRLPTRETMLGSVIRISCEQRQSMAIFMPSLACWRQYATTNLSLEVKSGFLFQGSPQQQPLETSIMFALTSFMQHGAVMRASPFVCRRLVQDSCEQHVFPASVM